MENNSYPALKTIETLLRIVGGILAVSGFLAIFFGIQIFGNVMVAVIVGIACMLASIPFFAFAEIIQVIVDIEKNTRLSIPPPVSSIDSVPANP